ncbi:hypothetical protein NKH10_19595 [Mesorhizobium sp. M1340]|uniref:hypothetical protein n=1 Tax=Mesorhizobium sp. M1340 TaxID=2957087 RepID=UPI0033366F7D
MNFYRLSSLLNRVCGGRADQTLCARIAERFGTQCLFCRVAHRLIEPNHCMIELVNWRRRIARKGDQA